MKIALIILLISCTVLCADVRPATGQIYYIPFHVETYEAITQANIKQKAFYKFEVNDRDKLSALLQLLAGVGEASSFGDNRVRLLVVSDKKQIFVDAEGNVFDGKKTHRLNHGNFDKLKTLLSELVKTP